MSATLALIDTSSAAPGSPLSHSTSLALLPPINSTSPALEVPGTLINLTLKYPRWPKDHYSIFLEGPGISRYDAYFETVWGKRVATVPPVKLPELQLFVRDFAHELGEKYPVPGFIPHLARQVFIDVVSYTRWEVQIQESVLHARMPTELALAAFDQVVPLLSRHGPSEMLWTIRIDGQRLPWAWGDLYMKPLGEASSKKSLPSEEGGFQTA